jgi:ornithine cyclodeaminase
VIVLSPDEVADLLDPDALVDALDAAMRDLSAGRCSVPPRVAATVDHGMLLAMPAFLPSAGVLTAKLVTQFPRNTDRPAHQALVCCFDPDDGTPLAVMDGEYLTTARTAAGAVLAARYLAGTGPVAVVGTGALARAHVAAFRRAGRDTVLVAGRDADRAAACAADTGAEPATSIEAAVRAAAIVCTCTHAAAPVVRREWLRDDAHVSSVGYNTAGTGEVDLDTLRDALVVVESRDAALAPAPAGAPELIAAMANGALARDDVREVGELTSDEQRGRLTVYKSVGVGVQDAAAAALVLRAARS